MRISDWSSDVCSSDLAVERGEYAHYMLKEIYEQPRALADTLSERLLGDHVLEAALGPAASRILPLVQSVHIVACGTRYHAGLVAPSIGSASCRERVCPYVSNSVAGVYL